MAVITATDAFDEEAIEQEDAEKLEPLLTWLNENMQNIVNALQGNLGDKNSSSRIVSVQTVSGVLEEFNIDGPVSNVTVVRLDCQPDSLLKVTGFNWWPKPGGFKFCASYEGEKLDRNLILKVDFNV